MQISALKTLNVALIAGAAALFAAPAAQAAVVSTLLTTPVTITNSIDGIYLNVVTGVSGASGSVVTGWDINPYNNGAGLTFYGVAAPYGIMYTGTVGTPATTTVAASLAIGTSISSANTFNQFQTVGTAFQGTTGTQYVGFKFLNETTGVADYGYLALSTTAGTGANAGFPTTILGWAYENTGAGITVASLTAAAVPEADNVAMLGLGLALVGATLAKRRKQA